MKMKKFFISLVLVVLTTMIFSGCEQSLTKDLNEFQQIAKDFLNTKGYEVPYRYTLSYLTETRDKLAITYDNEEIVFDISSENDPQIFSIKIQLYTITNEEIKETEKIVNDFLNTKGYIVPKNYEIKYKEMNKKTLEISKVVNEEGNYITITYDISKKQIEILDVSYYIVSQDGKILGFVTWIFLVIIIILGASKIT